MSSDDEPLFDCPSDASLESEVAPIAPVAATARGETNWRPMLGVTRRFGYRMVKQSATSAIPIPRPTPPAPPPSSNCFPDSSSEVASEPSPICSGYVDFVSMKPFQIMKKPLPNQVETTPQPSRNHSKTK